MFSMLLIDFMEYLSAPQRIAGLTLIILGTASVLLAKKITKVIRKIDEVDKSDTLFEISDVLFEIKPIDWVLLSAPINLKAELCLSSEPANVK